MVYFFLMKLYFSEFSTVSSGTLSGGFLRQRYFESWRHHKSVHYRSVSLLIYTIGKEYYSWVEYPNRKMAIKNKVEG